MTKNMLDCSCPLCGLESETPNHLYLKCEFSRIVHFSSPLGARIPCDMVILDWLVGCFDSSDYLQTQLLYTLLWKIWNSRNLVHFQQVQKDPVCVALEAWDYVAKFNEANPTPKKVISEPIGWRSDRQAKDLAVIQEDAGCFEDSFVAFGCLIKSWDSKIIYVACRRDTMIVDPAMDEMLAIRWCLQITK